MYFQNVATVLLQHKYVLYYNSKYNKKFARGLQVYKLLQNRAQKLLHIQC